MFSNVKDYTNVHVVRGLYKCTCYTRITEPFALLRNLTLVLSFLCRQGGGFKQNYQDASFKPFIILG